MDLGYTQGVIVGEVVAGEAAKVRKELEQVITQSNRSMFDIGELLYKIKKNGYYHGFDTFYQYTKSLDFKNRRLHYLTTIAEVMDAVGVKRETYEPLGISKLREITSLDPNGEWVNLETKEVTPIREFIKAFVDKGHEMPLEEIKQHVRVLKGLIGEDELVWVNLRVKKSVLETVIRPALDKAKLLIGSTGTDDEGNAKDASDGRAAESIFADFLSGE